MPTVRAAFVFLICWASGLTELPAFEIPKECGQVIVVTSRDWADSHANLTLWQRDGGEPWRIVFKDIAVRLGKNGMAWGRGMHPEMDSPLKREGDGCSPAGIFELGKVYGYETNAPAGCSLPYHQVTAWDHWVEDPASEQYNQHVRFDSDTTYASEWRTKQRMKLDDPSHSLKLFIRHNAPPGVVPGAGSAIFFHIWRREGEAASTGCTVLAEKKLRQLLAELKPENKPLLVQLPVPVYQKIKTSWKLPPLP